MRKRPTNGKDWQASPEKNDERINRLKTAGECAIFSKNAAARGFPELANRAERRAVELQAATHEVRNETERAAFEAVYAYERMLTKTAGKKTRATSIWNIVRRLGIVEAVQRTVNRDPEVERYMTLKATGMDDLAFESVVAKHPAEFAQDTVATANARLAEWVQL